MRPFAIAFIDRNIALDPSFAKILPYRIRVIGCISINQCRFRSWPASSNIDPDFIRHFLKSDAIVLISASNQHAQGQTILINREVNLHSFALLMTVIG